MKTKRFINGLALAFSAVMTMLFVGCNPEQPENEKENKLHEDPVRAVFTLQEGTLDNASAFGWSRLACDECNKVVQRKE